MKLPFNVPEDALPLLAACALPKKDENSTEYYIKVIFADKIHYPEYFSVVVASIIHSYCTELVMAGVITQAQFDQCEATMLTDIQDMLPKLITKNKND